MMLVLLKGVLARVSVDFESCCHDMLVHSSIKCELDRGLCGPASPDIFVFIMSESHFLLDLVMIKKFLD